MGEPTSPKSDLDLALEEAEYKALDSLSRYKFMMFGYWAAIWVHLNKCGPKKQKSPFSWLVLWARQQKAIRDDVTEDE